MGSGLGWIAREIEGVGGRRGGTSWVWLVVWGRRRTEGFVGRMVVVVSGNGKRLRVGVVLVVHFVGAELIARQEGRNRLLDRLRLRRGSRGNWRRMKLRW